MTLTKQEQAWLKEVYTWVDGHQEEIHTNILLTTANIGQYLVSHTRSLSGGHHVPREAPTLVHRIPREAPLYWDQKIPPSSPLERKGKKSRVEHEVVIEPSGFNNNSFKLAKFPPPSQSSKVLSSSRTTRTSRGHPYTLGCGVFLAAKFLTYSQLCLARSTLHFIAVSISNFYYVTPCQVLLVTKVAFSYPIR